MLFFLRILTLTQGFVLFAGETQFNADAIRQLQVHSVTDNSTYAYQFSNLFHSDNGFLNYPSWAKTSADHGEELPFVWGMLLEKEQYQNLTKGGFKLCNLCKYSSKAWQQILTRNVTSSYIYSENVYIFRNSIVDFSFTAYFGAVDKPFTYVKIVESLPAEFKSLTEAMVTMWTNFARTG